jgi:hypothetical protein
MAHLNWTHVAAGIAMSIDVGNDPVDPVLKRYSDLNDALRVYW